MPGTLIHLTAAGRAALVGPDNVGTVTRQIVSVGIAHAPFVHDDELTVLPNEHKRIATIAGTNVADDTIHVTIRDDSDDQYTAYGYGLYLDNGALLGTTSQATPILEKSPDAIFLLSTDMIFVSIDAGLLTFGDASFANPPASETAVGVVELATDAEAAAGLDGTRAVTPKNIKPLLAAKLDKAGGSISGSLMIGTAVDDGSGAALQVSGYATANTPASGDSSRKLATTEFVMNLMSQAEIGQIVLESRTGTRAGYIKPSGVLLNRADYPALWTYAQGSGALVSEADWAAGRWACYSTGDGATTFRIPELRGEHIRFLDDGRGIDTGRLVGSYQAPQTMSHNHTAGASAVGDHSHGAWTDTQGWHGHDGGTSWVGDHQHGTAIGQSSGVGMPWGLYEANNNRPGVGSQDGDNSLPWSSPGGGHSHSFSTNGNGSHGHNIGMNGAGNHTHTITVNATGGTEVRVRSVALTPLLRAY
ncbi:hypothetical protein D9M69_142490 [compost metagenome]